MTQRRKEPGSEKAKWCHKLVFFRPRKSCSPHQYGTASCRTWSSTSDSRWATLSSTRWTSDPAGPASTGTARGTPSCAARCPAGSARSTRTRHTRGSIQFSEQSAGLPGWAVQPPAGGPGGLETTVGSRGRKRRRRGKRGGKGEGEKTWRGLKGDNILGDSSIQHKGFQLKERKFERYSEEIKP